MCNDDFRWLISDITDEDLANAYEQYMDAKGTRWFSAIYWEANRRGLTLCDLEEILIRIQSHSAH